MEQETKQNLTIIGSVLALILGIITLMSIWDPEKLKNIYANFKNLIQKALQTNSTHL